MSGTATIEYNIQSSLVQHDLEGVLKLDRSVPDWHALDRFSAQ